MDSLENHYYKLEIPVKKNLPYKEILSDHRSVFIKPEGSLSSQNELTKPNSFSTLLLTVSFQVQH